MNRHVIIVVVLASLFCAACGGGDAGCEAVLGVCSPGGNPADAGTSGTGIGGLAANYGRPCALSGDACTDVPGTKCEYVGLPEGVCTRYVVQGSGSSCPAGTMGTHGSWGVCLRLCGSDSCPGASRSMCYSVPGGQAQEVPGGTRVCVPSATNATGGTTPSPIGGACTNDGECAGSARCATGSSFPGGYCSMTCTNNASVCGAANVCVSSSSWANSSCMARCASPGGQSTCRAGYSCRALQGVSYGACM